MRPILFDVSLRDGIQGANPKDYPTHKKIEVMKNICDNYSPHKIEIGSFASPRVLPIMSDTVHVFDAFTEHVYDELDPPEAYALVPNKIGLHTAINYGVRNFSFITSISNAFQVKNTGKNLDYKKTELKEMLKIVETLKEPAKTKLYVSCVNECPITGIMDSDLIIHEILSYNSQISSSSIYDEICISDTMGSLLCKDFEYIADGLLRFGVSKSQISIHLHVNDENANEAKRILFACFKRGIHKFDVSFLSEGGCSVTMEKRKMKPNMTYDFFNSTLKEYNITELDHF
jgi:isopropylmalate/homocitrate/citramalate synthase